jgi:hypothetical protein
MALLGTRRRRHAPACEPGVEREVVFVAEVRELSWSECEALLRAGVAGRVAFAAPGGPHITPVNYSVIDGAVVIETSPHGLLGTYGAGALLAFEVDQLDHERQRGWSVVAKGRGASVDTPEEVNRIRRGWEPKPWASGPRGLYLRLQWTELTGRQLGLAWDPMSDLPGRRAAPADVLGPSLHHRDN